jgi:hypothetical protein
MDDQGKDDADEYHGNKGDEDPVPFRFNADVSRQPPEPFEQSRDEIKQGRYHNKKKTCND